MGRRASPETAFAASSGRAYTLGDYIINRENMTMAHIVQERTKLLNRLKRIKGQVEAIERAVLGDKECSKVLQQATSCRGAMNGFIAEVIEDHIREHMIGPATGAEDPRRIAAEELVEIVHAYLT
jgi:DNA-binding FrmR family transcriptional regulator